MAKQEKEPTFKQWYRQMINDDQEEIGTIANTAAIRLKDKAKIPVDPEMTIALYCGVLDALINYLKDKQSEAPEFWISIFDVMEIGYNTLENDADEKTGNFNIKIYYLPDAPRIVTDPTLGSADDVTAAWVTAHNLNTDVDYLIKDIFAYVKDYLANHMNITVEQPAMILLMFLMINEEIVMTVKIRRQELDVSDFFITMAGLFDIHCMNTDKGERVMFKTNPAPKQFIKDDGKETLKHED